MINIDDDPKEIVKELSETEKNILFILGKMRISVNKNVNEHSLKKKLNLHLVLNIVPLQEI